MTRVLTAVQVTVRPAQAAAWLATVQSLATRLGARGLHLWVFRARGEPDRYLEFTEGKDDATHRRHGPADADEAALERRLQELATYPATPAVVWEEMSVSLPEERS